ncbi:hypothetical protein [Streptomyces chryseus]
MPVPEEARLLIVKPGDTLVLGHMPSLTTERADILKQALSLAAVVTFPGEVDLAVLRPS